MGDMKYNVGDKVRIKSLGWYDENKDVYGYIECGKSSMNFETSQLCGKIVTISRINDATNTYRIEEDNGFYNWTDEMIECLVEEEVGLVDNLSSRWVNEFELPDGYIFKDENGNEILTSKIILEKKKNKYPKSYKECCKILGIEGSRLIFNSKDITEYEENLVCKIGKLEHIIVCRDAYWKVAGEEMGLGKPWKPDWNDGEWKWCMSYSGNYIEFDQYKSKHHTLAFPTAEMRDAFYENFKEEIESCKEFL